MVDLVVAAGQGGEAVDVDMDPRPERPLVDRLGPGNQAGGCLLLVLVLTILRSWRGAFLWSVPSLADHHHGDHDNQGNQCSRNHRHDQDHFGVGDVASHPDPLDVDLAGHPESDVVGDKTVVRAEALLHDHDVGVYQVSSTKYHLHQPEGDRAGQPIAAHFPIVASVAFLPMEVHV